MRQYFRTDCFPNAGDVKMGHRVDRGAFLRGCNLNCSIMEDAHIIIRLFSYMAPPKPHARIKLS